MTPRPSPRPAARALAVASLVPLLSVLAGCSGLGDPSAAAVIDGRTISEQDVQTIAAELSADSAAGLTPAQVVPLLLVQDTVAEIAAQSTGASSREDAQAVLDSGTAEEQPPGQYSDVTLDFVATNLELNAIQQDEQAVALFNERLGELEADINPRYGAVTQGEGLEGIQGGITSSVAFPWLPAVEDELPQG